MGIDIEKQQSTVAKDDTLAEPNKDAALPKRQDDAQKKGAGKMLEEKHSPSDKVNPAVDALGLILLCIGGCLLFFAIFFLGCGEDHECRDPDGGRVMVIGAVLMLLGGFLKKDFDDD